MDGERGAEKSEEGENWPPAEKVDKEGGVMENKKRKSLIQTQRQKNHKFNHNYVKPKHI